MACISANAAVVAGAGAIAQGAARAVLVGGAETMSDVPIRYHREVRKRMLKSQKVKGLGGYLGLLAGLQLAHLAPELPAIAEFSTGEVMGHSADRLAATWGVTREEQDAFAFRSHTLAAEMRDGRYDPRLRQWACCLPGIHHKARVVGARVSEVVAEFP
jgi:acetyl-CoA acetyltransferase